MKKLTFPALVREEAENLKKFATKRERSSLDFQNFHARGIDSCIYGQLTGSCFSSRAKTLIKKCARRVYKCMGSRSQSESLSNRLNGKPGNNRHEYWSPIEVFISQPHQKNMINGANERLIKYLKGEIETL